MNIKIKRFQNSAAGGGWTLGRMFLDDSFFCFTCEDEKRSTKVRGETRIPPGTYPVKFREVASDKTAKYRKKYPWFTWHLELQNVPGFQYVYIHVGNSEADTDGCILVGMQVNIANGTVGSSGIAFEKLYGDVSKVLAGGGQVQITIEDE